MDRNAEANTPAAAAPDMTDARIGDWVVETNRSYNQRGLIVGVYSSHGTPPYLVHWQDGGQDCMFVPGPGTQLVHAPPV